MQTFRTSGDGTPHISFEIEHLLISRRTIARLLKTVAGVKNVEEGGRFGSSNDLRLSFKYFDEDYVVWEPYGDNSRYWIGPKALSATSRGCTDLESAFRSYDPPLLRKALNALLGLGASKGRAQPPRRSGPGEI